MIFHLHPDQSLKGWSEEGATRVRWKSNTNRTRAASQPTNTDPTATAAHTHTHTSRPPRSSRKWEVEGDKRGERDTLIYLPPSHRGGPADCMGTTPCSPHSAASRFNSARRHDKGDDSMGCNNEGRQLLEHPINPVRKPVRFCCSYRAFMRFSLCRTTPVQTRRRGRG